MSERRVGLFGGSFDPVHRAHGALAETALAQLRLDELRWIPTGQAWQKARSLSPAEHRLAMLRLAIAHEPRFVLDPIELERPGPSYMIDTVHALAQSPTQTRWVLLIGHDQYAALHTWHRWRELLDAVELAVAPRPLGAPLAVHPDVAAHPHRVVPLPPTELSSTGIRRRAAAGEDLTPWLHPAVARYIETHGLYRAPTGS